MADDTGDKMLLVNNGDGRYLRYFAELDRALGMLASWTHAYCMPPLKAAVHAEYLRGLLACYRMLQSRFTFESDDSLMVDLSRSGYPHSYMLARIATDRAAALNEHLKGDALGAARYKQVFLNDLFETGSVNPALLNRIACARYAEVVAAMDGSFDPRFMRGSPIPDPEHPKRYQLHWCAFDPAQNVPMLFGMVFDYGGMDLTRALEGLRLVLKHESKAGVSIAALAHGVDTGVPDIHPLSFSRAILGPLHLPSFPLTGEAKPELEGLLDAEGPMIEITLDHTRAVGSKKPSRLAVTFGVSSAESRIYAIRTNDPLCYERGADAVERVLLLPHRVLQRMRREGQGNDLRHFTLIPYIKEGELQ